MHPSEPSTEPRPRERLWNRLFLLAALPVILTVIVSAWFHSLPEQGLTFDYWEHAAALKALSRSLLHPSEPHTGLPVPSARFMPYFLALAAAARLLSLDVLQTLALSASLNVVLFYVGIYVFFRGYFRTSRAAFLAALVLPAAWGPAWLWSNVYQVRCLLYTASYPSMMVMGLGFLVLASATRALRAERLGVGPWAMLALLCALALLCHPLTGVFATGTAGLMALLETGVARRRRLCVLGAIGAGLLASTAWPLFPVWDVVFGTTRGEPWIQTGTVRAQHAAAIATRHPMYDHRQVAMAIGPAWLGLVACAWLLRGGRCRWIPAGVLLALVPWAVNPVFHVPLGHRGLLFAVFFLHTALVAALLALFDGRATPSRARRVAAAFGAAGLAVLAAFNVALTGLDLAGWSWSADLAPPTRNALRTTSPERLRRMAALMPDNAVVLAPKDISWPLPAFGRHVVALFNDNPFVIDRRQRNADTEAFFTGTADGAQRLDILRRYGVTHVVMPSSKTAPAVVEDLRRLGQRLGRVGDCVVIRLDPAPW